MKKSIVLLSTADWDNPFWTNKQHVAVELSKEGYSILYINSLGIRKPKLNSIIDLKRIFSKVFNMFSKPVRINELITVWTPPMLPLASKKWIAELNRKLLIRGIKRIFKKELSEITLWTYSPLTTKYFNPDDFESVIYHCVDEIKAQPGMPVKEIENFERELVLRSNYIFTTSQALQESRSKINRKTYYFPNVADFDHFSKATLIETTIPEDIAKIKNPIIGFIGAISSYKLDFDLILYCANKLPEASFIFIGKIGEGDPWTSADALENQKNIIFLGPKEYKELPNYLKAFNVAILPNKINEYTRSMFPMKFFEYLAAGKGVVATDLESLNEFGHLHLKSASYEQFLANIKSILNGDSYLDLNILKTYASQNTYKTRMEKMLKIING